MSHGYSFLVVDYDDELLGVYSPVSYTFSVIILALYHKSTLLAIKTLS